MNIEHAPFVKAKKKFQALALNLTHPSFLNVKPQYS